MTGAAVRLTGSGLGCPNWPKCYGSALPPLSTHALIEFGNRALSGLVGVLTVVAAVLAFTRRPFRRDLVLLALVLPLGGRRPGRARRLHGPRTPRARFRDGSLRSLDDHPDRAVALAWRARYEPGSRSRSGDRLTVWSVRALAPLCG